MAAGVNRNDRFCHAARVLACVLAAHTLMAQAEPSHVTRGRVVSARSREGLANASLEVLGAGDSVMSTTSDSLGRFVLPRASGASWTLLVRRLGFAAQRYSAEQVAAMGALLIQMEPVATLEEMQITAPSYGTRWLSKQGFFVRQKEGFGKFLDSATVATRRPTSLQNLLRAFIRGCTLVLVDGIPASIAGIELDQVLAIEVYESNLAAPPRFYNSEEHMSRCGSVVVWRVH